MQAFAKIAAGSAVLLLSSARADKAHGLDNNWLVRVEGMKDANDCIQITSVSAITDLGMNLGHYNNTRDPKCEASSGTCSDNYACTEVADQERPDSFEGCTYSSSTGTNAATEGIIMDGLCYNNFIVQQKSFNGNPRVPGLAPDLVYVRTDADLHTRSCLVVKYCAGTGYYLVAKPSGATIYEKAARFDPTGAEKVFEWLVGARHPNCALNAAPAPAPAPSPADADRAAGNGGMLLALGLGAAAATQAA